MRNKNWFDRLFNPLTVTERKKNPLLEEIANLDIGFSAQDVEVLEKAAGYKIADKTNLTTSLSNDGKQYGLQYSKFVPILVKAVQELSAKVKKLEEG